MKNITIYLFCIVTLTSFSAITLAETYNAEELSAFTEKYLLDNLPKPPVGELEIIVNKLDPRIKISPCDTDIKVNIPENNYSRNVNIKIYCDGQSPWQLYLPTKINTIVPLVFAKQRINKGTLLSEDNLIVKYQNINNIRGETISEIATISGTKAKRNISKNKPLSMNNICYVCKDDSVTIIAQSSNLRIKTKGIALSSGAIGDTIKVKNVKSKKTVYAEVKNTQQVIINL